jgi:hypothetical protein
MPRTPTVTPSVTTAAAATTVFDKDKDKIAVVVRDFTMKRLHEGLFDYHAEPYIVSTAIDAGGGGGATIEFNVKPFPNVRQGDKITFDGQGHLVYGPKNPGEYVVYSILFMESDQDVRDLGQTIEDILKSEATKLGLKAILAARPEVGLALTLVEKLTELVASLMKKNADDELYRRSGTLLRDVEPPFDVLRSYIGGNEYIECKTSIIPLSQSNMLGTQVKKLNL